MGGTCSDPAPDVAAADVEAEHHGDAEPHHRPGALLGAGQEAAPAAAARPGGGHTHAATASPRPGQMSTDTNPSPCLLLLSVSLHPNYETPRDCVTAQKTFKLILTKPHYLFGY